MSIRSFYRPSTKLLVGLVVMMGIWGCAKAPKEETRQQPEVPVVSPKSQVAQSKQVNPDVVNKLVGVWLGTATLDEPVFEKALSQLSNGNRKLALSQARSFLSTVMAIEFRKDGSIESEVEIVTVDGDTIRDTSTGAWQLVESVGDQVRLEMQENQSDGSITTDQKVYQFVENNKFVLKVPVSDQLTRANARLIFVRQILPRNNVAQGGMENPQR